MKAKFEIILGVLMLFLFIPGSARADFDERLWPEYAEIILPVGGPLTPLGIIHNSDLWYLGKTRIPFADARIVDQDRREIPYQILTLGPRTVTEEIPVRIVNRSETVQGDVSLEGIIEKGNAPYNAVEILTPEKNFQRIVQLRGSHDGKTWNILIHSAVIFDDAKGERLLHHTTLSFPDATFRHLALTIGGTGEKPLAVSGIRVRLLAREPGREVVVDADLDRSGAVGKESIYIAKPLSSVLSVSTVRIETAEKNFQRAVSIQVKSDTGEWRQWADGMIYRFETERIKEAGLNVSIPSVTAREIRLVVKNHDSPPLDITAIRLVSHAKALLFKLDGRQRYYLFWGNLRAKEPRYDLTQLAAKVNPASLSQCLVGPRQPNPAYIGEKASLPLTERYKALIYVVVILLMAGLIFLQYRVIKRTEKS